MTSATSDYLLVTDYLDAPLIGPVGHCSRRGGAIQQPGEPFGPVAGQPLAPYQELSALDAEPGVTVQLHPASSLGLIAWQLSASK